MKTKLKNLSMALNRLQHMQRELMRMDIPGVKMEVSYRNINGYPSLWVYFLDNEEPIYMFNRPGCNDVNSFANIYSFDDEELVEYCMNQVEEAFKYIINNHKK